MGRPSENVRTPDHSIYRALHMRCSATRDKIVQSVVHYSVPALKRGSWFGQISHSSSSEDAASMTSNIAPFRVAFVQTVSKQLLGKYRSPPGTDRRADGSVV